MRYMVITQSEQPGVIPTPSDFLQFKTLDSAISGANHLIALDIYAHVGVWQTDQDDGPWSMAAWWYADSFDSETKQVHQRAS